jgi:hypothetical protein
MKRVRLGVLAILGLVVASGADTGAQPVVQCGTIEDCSSDSGCREHDSSLQPVKKQQEGENPWQMGEGQCGWKFCITLICSCGNKYQTGEECPDPF